MKNTQKRKQGSVALISVLIICAFLLIIVMGMSEARLSTGYQYVDSYSSKISYYDAESCLEETIHRLEMDTSFQGTTLLVPQTGSVCTSTVSGGNNIKDIVISDINGNYTQQYSGQISITQNGTANNAVLLKWQKI